MGLLHQPLIGFDWRPAMFCDPASCPTAWAGLVIGLLLALFALWFFLRTRKAASVLISLLSMRHWHGFRRVSRAGRILSLIAAECWIVAGLVPPALEHLLPLAPQLVQFIEFVGVASFLVAFALLAFVVWDRDIAWEQDEDKPKI